jgi:hypothetical protein
LVPNTNRLSSPNRLLYTKTDRVCVKKTHLEINECVGVSNTDGQTGNQHRQLRKPDKIGRPRVSDSRVTRPEDRREEIRINKMKKQHFIGSFKFVQLCVGPFCTKFLG